MEDPANGFCKKEQSGKWFYTFQFKPSTYICVSEGLQGSAISVREQQLKHSVWFNVRLSSENENLNPLKTDISGIEEYNHRMNYFNVIAPQNFQLIYGKAEPVKPIAYTFETDYGLTPRETMIVGFSIPDETPIHGFRLEYFDGLFNAGILKFSLDSNQLKYLPQLQKG